MGGSAGGSMGHMSNMSGLAACNVSDSQPMQFPLTQRRKRRVLFTQAQVSIFRGIPLFSTHSLNVSCSKFIQLSNILNSLYLFRQINIEFISNKCVRVKLEVASRCFRNVMSPRPS